MIFNISQPIDKLANKKLFIESLSKAGFGAGLAVRQAHRERLIRNKPFNGLIQTNIVINVLASKLPTCRWIVSTFPMNAKVVVSWNRRRIHALAGRERWLEPSHYADCG
jgi:hypothetical protein